MPGGGRAGAGAGAPQAPAPGLTAWPSRLQVLLFLQEEKEEIAAETQVTRAVAPLALPPQQRGPRPPAAPAQAAPCT